MRRPRAFADGVFHLCAHASDLRYLFLNDHDREDFLDRLASVCHRFELGILSYVLIGPCRPRAAADPARRGGSGGGVGGSGWRRSYLTQLRG